MKISVVIPVFNKEVTVEKCLLSVIKQSSPVSEVIVINDGSTDNSGAVIQRVVASANQVKIKYIEQKNQGVSAARNLGIKNSAGDFICFLDADDIWDENFCNCLKLLIKDYPLANIYSLHHRIKRGSKIILPVSGLAAGFRGYVDNFFRCSLRGTIVKSSKVCIRSSVFSDESNLFPEGVVAGEDLYVWIQVAKKGKVAFDDNVLCTVIQEEDESRGGRINSIPYPLVFFSTKDNKLQLDFDAKNYIALIGLKHAFSDLINLNLKSFIRRWAYVWKFSPIRAVFPFYILLAHNKC